MTSSAGLLVQARHEAGMTQRQLARRTGVAQPLISAYERGHRQPGADMLLRLLRGTGHDLRLASTVEASRVASAKLEQVCAMAMALPVRDRGPLAFPAWSSFAS